MSDPRPRRRPVPVPRRPVSRRSFLERSLAMGAVTIGGSALAACSSGSAIDRARSIEPNTSATDEPAGRRLPDAVDGRILVIVDLQGGNDGLSTVVPAADPGYHDRRPNLAIADTDVLAIDDRIGLHPRLGRLHRRGVVTVEGVGPIDGNLSHFAMTERWERGDVTGTVRPRTGFLGRLADAVAADGASAGPLVGLSLAGPTRHLVTARATTMSLRDRGDLWYLTDDEWSEATAFRSGLAAMGRDRTGAAAVIAESQAQLAEIARRLPAGDDEVDWDDPMLSEGGELGRQLFLATDLLAADAGVRIVYTALGGFDTHDDHGWLHPELMAELDAAVDGFCRRCDETGLVDQVVVATISEFGRRVRENGSGLDHGAASTMLVTGAVDAGSFGEPPPLDALDDDGNLAVTTGFDRYLAALAEGWLGVEAASVLDGSPDPIPLFA